MSRVYVASSWRTTHPNSVWTEERVEQLKSLRALAAKGRAA